MFRGITTSIIVPSLIHTFDTCPYLLVSCLPTVVDVPVTFTLPLEDTTVTEDESASLICETSKPDQPVEWLKDGAVFKPGKKSTAKVEAKGTVHRLTFEPASAADKGVYTAKLPDDQTSAKLTVEGMHITPLILFCGVDSFIFLTKCVTYLVP